MVWRITNPMSKTMIVSGLGLFFKKSGCALARGRPLRFWLAFEYNGRHEYDGYYRDYQGAETKVHRVAGVTLEWVDDVHCCGSVDSGAEFLMKVIYKI